MRRIWCALIMASVAALVVVTPGTRASRLGHRLAAQTTNFFLPPGLSKAQQVTPNVVFKGKVRLTISGTISTKLPQTTGVGTQCNDAFYWSVSADRSGSADCSVPWTVHHGPTYGEIRVGPDGCPVPVSDLKAIGYLLSPVRLPAYQSSHVYKVRLVASGRLCFYATPFGNTLSTYTIGGGFNMSVGLPSAPDKTPKVTLSGLSGSVEINPQQGGWRPAQVGDKLQAGDTIYTGWKAKVTLTFPDGSKMMLRPMTELVLQQLEMGPNGRLKAKSFLKLGMINVQVHRITGSAADFQVKTPTTTASVRGTIFSVLYAGAITIVSVTTDSVLVTPNQGRPVVVPAGKEVASTATGAGPLMPVGKAGAPPGSVGPEQAISLLTAATAKGFSACKSDGYSAALAPSANGWRATVTVRGSLTGSAIWTITGKEVAPSNQLATTITGGCMSGGNPLATSTTTPTPGLTPTATSAPTRVPTGHYAGATGQSDIISFDVTPDSGSVTNLKAAGDVTCTDSSTWTWTVASSDCLTSQTHRRVAEGNDDGFVCVTTSASHTSLVLECQRVAARGHLLSSRGHESERKRRVASCCVDDGKARRTIAGSRCVVNTKEYRYRLLVHVRS